MVLAALSDGSKVVVTAMPGYRESTESWSEVLRGLKERGLECPRLVIGDGHLGIWGALRNGEKGVAVREGCVLRQEIGVSTLGMIRGAVGFLTLTTAGCDDPEPTATPTATD